MNLRYTVILSIFFLGIGSHSPGIAVPDDGASSLAASGQEILDSLKSVSGEDATEVQGLCATLRDWISSGAEVAQLPEILGTLARLANETDALEDLISPLIFARNSPLLEAALAQGVEWTGDDLSSLMQGFLDRGWRFNHLRDVPFALRDRWERHVRELLEPETLSPEQITALVRADAIAHQLRPQPEGLGRAIQEKSAGFMGENRENLARHMPQAFQKVGPTVSQALFDDWQRRLLPFISDADNFSVWKIFSVCEKNMLPEFQEALEQRYINVIQNRLNRVVNAFRECSMPDSIWTAWCQRAEELVSNNGQIWLPTLDDGRYKSVVASQRELPDPLYRRWIDYVCGSDEDVTISTAYTSHLFTGRCPAHALTEKVAEIYHTLPNPEMVHLVYKRFQGEDPEMRRHFAGITFPPIVALEREAVTLEQEIARGCRNIIVESDGAWHPLENGLTGWTVEETPPRIPLGADRLPISEGAPPVAYMHLPDIKWRHLRTAEARRAYLDRELAQFFTVGGGSNEVGIARPVPRGEEAGAALGG